MNVRHLRTALPGGRIVRRALSLALAVGIIAACAQPKPEPAPAPVADSTAVVPAGSDLCYLTVAEALKNPRLDVDQVPAPVKMDPPVFKPPYPRGVFGKGNSMDLEFEVLVDTLGKADLSTFTVVKSSNAWFVTQAKKAVAKWNFTPATKTGCKVPRVYKLGVSLGTKAGK